MQEDSIRLAMVDSLPISSGLAAIALANKGVRVTGLSSVHLPDPFGSGVRTELVCVRGFAFDHFCGRRVLPQVCYTL